jgi:hypothetical protein
MEIRTIGIDLGKTVFHLIGVNARGEVVVRKKCSRTQLLRFRIADLHGSHLSRENASSLGALTRARVAMIGIRFCARAPHGGWSLHPMQNQAYSGLGVETHDSAQHRYVDGQLQRSKKPQQIRGLNQNHNHEMKRIFKSTAMSASRCAGPLQDFYAGLLAKGMKPDMARLTLARKIAAITLTLWKKGERFDAEHLKSQAA